jgi:hypothetical protein
VHLQGWDVTIHGGRVEFRPPAIIDPDRSPRSADEKQHRATGRTPRPAI